MDTNEERHCKTIIFKLKIVEFKRQCLRWCSYEFKTSRGVCTILKNYEMIFNKNIYMNKVIEQVIMNL